MKINKKKQSNSFIFLLLIFYTIAIVFVSYHHELWRDEVRALSIIISSSSLADLFVNLQNEGHPSLWYMILYAGYNIPGTPEVIRIVHIIIAVFSVFIFLKSSPFSKFEMTLFIFGYFVLYEYAVINRNYGLSMLLIFLYCLIYKHRLKKIIQTSIILFFLANTNAHSIIIAFAFSLILIKDYLAESDNQSKASIRVFLISIFIIFSGIVLSIIQIYPEESSTITHIFTFNTLTIFKNIAKSFIIPGQHFPTIFGINNLFLTTLLIWIFGFTLLKKIDVFLYYFFSVIGLALFFNFIYPVNGPRHEGFFILILISAYWIEKYYTQNSVIKNHYLNNIAIFFYKKRKIIFISFLIVQIFHSYTAIKKEISGDYSSSEAFGKFLNQSSEFDNAVIICEPDYLIESLPFYAHNKIYFVREDKFGLKADFTSESKSEINLEFLINKAQQLRSSEKKNIMFVFGYELNENGPFILQAGFKRIFSYDKQQYKNFRNSTKLIANFRDSFNDENYDVYVLK